MTLENNSHSLNMQFPLVEIINMLLSCGWRVRHTWMGVVMGHSSSTEHHIEIKPRRNAHTYKAWYLCERSIVCESIQSRWLGGQRYEWRFWLTAHGFSDFTAVRVSQYQIQRLMAGNSKSTIILDNWLKTAAVVAKTLLLKKSMVASFKVLGIEIKFTVYFFNWNNVMPIIPLWQDVI